MKTKYLYVIEWHRNYKVWALYGSNCAFEDKEEALKELKFYREYALPFVKYRIVTYERHII